MQLGDERGLVEKEGMTTTTTDQEPGTATGYGICTFFTAHINFLLIFTIKMMIEKLTFGLVTAYFGCISSNPFSNFFSTLLTELIVERMKLTNG